MLTTEVVVDGYDDGLPGIVAISDDYPDLVGRGDTDAEALADWLDQLHRIVLH